MFGGGGGGMRRLDLLVERYGGGLLRLDGGRIFGWGFWHRDYLEW